MKIIFTITEHTEEKEDITLSKLVVSSDLKNVKENMKNLEIVREYIDDILWVANREHYKLI